MCLDKLSEKPILKKEHGYYIGWKVYKGYDDKRKKLIPEWQGKPQPIGTWMHEKRYRYDKSKTKERIMTIIGNKYYPRGFHIFLEPRLNTSIGKRGIIYSNRKVYFDDIVAYGMQGLWSVIVAKKMKILNQRNQSKKDGVKQNE